MKFEHRKLLKKYTQWTFAPVSLSTLCVNFLWNTPFQHLHITRHLRDCRSVLDEPQWLIASVDWWKSIDWLRTLQTNYLSDPISAELRILQKIASPEIFMIAIERSGSFRFRRAIFPIVFLQYCTAFLCVKRSIELFAHFFVLRKTKFARYMTTMTFNWQHMTTNLSFIISIEYISEFTTRIGSNAKLLGSSYYTWIAPADPVRLSYKFFGWNPRKYADFFIRRG